MRYAIKVEELGKQYKLYSKPLDSLKEWLTRKQCHEVIIALNGISFELKQGETLGLVGNNGAGKSTLLKILSGTMSANQGRYRINGRLSAILELGSGFHPEFSGRENARMSCALMGLNELETNKVLPEIIAFSELGEFIDKPVKTYSSGMYVRLAFSAVTSIDPQILLVDEALSVGDQHFQRKSLNRMREFRESGKTIVFCTHNLYQIKELCNKALWLDNGHMIEYGDAYEVVDNYQDALRQQDVESEKERRKQLNQAKSEDYINSVDIGGDQKDGCFEFGGRLFIKIKINLASIGPESVHVGIVIMRNDHIHCYGVSTQIDNVKLQMEKDGIYQCQLELSPLQLLSGKYYFCIYLLDRDGIHVYDYREETCPFTVRHKTKEVGIAQLNHQWIQ